MLEYGTAAAWTEALPEESLVLGGSHTMSNFAYKRDVAAPIFRDADGQTQYTNVLVGFSQAQCAQDLTRRSYILLENARGQRVTLYGGQGVRSIGYIAWQNRDTFNPGTEAYEYVWTIIRGVYAANTTASTKTERIPEPV